MVAWILTHQRHNTVSNNAAQTSTAIIKPNGGRMPPESTVTSRKTPNIARIGIRPEMADCNGRVKRPAFAGCTLTSASISASDPSLRYTATRNGMDTSNATLHSATRWASLVGNQRDRYSVANGAAYDAVRKMAAASARFTAICSTIRRVMLNSVGPPVSGERLASHCEYRPKVFATGAGIERAMRRVIGSAALIR